MLPTITTKDHIWRRVNRAAPCIVCGRPQWCGRSDDGLLLCMRSGDTPHGYKLVRENPDGGVLFAPVDDRPMTRPPSRPKPKRPDVDWTKMHAKARAEIIPGELYDFADAELGLSGESMDLLDVGVVDDDYVFPERDASGRIIGLVKRTTDGEKKSMFGSRRGLTYQHPLPDDDPVLVVEGATDTAAAIEAGFTAVGRPTASGGGDLLADLLRGRAVIVCGENDRKSDGSWPGRDGVERIAQQLRPVCRSVRVLFPPDGVKDLRTWLGGAP